MFWCVDGTPIRATLAEMLKVNLDLWNLFIAIVSFGSTYQVRIMTLASTVFKKWNFQKKSHLNALGANLTLTLSRSSQFRFIIWTNLVGPTSQKLHTKSQGHWPSGSWEEDFLNGFYHIWAWRPSWSCDQNILHKFWLTYHKESSHEIWVQLDQWFVRKLCFNILMGLQYERPKLKGQRSTLTVWTYL